MKTRTAAAWLCAAMILSAAASSCGPAENLGSIFDWGGIFSTITGFATAKNPNFASAYAKKESAVKKAIDTFLTTLDTIE